MQPYGNGETAMGHRKRVIVDGWGHTVADSADLIAGSNLVPCTEQITSGGSLDAPNPNSYGDNDPIDVVLVFLWRRPQALVLYRCRTVRHDLGWAKEGDDCP